MTCDAARTAALVTRVTALAHPLGTYLRHDWPEEHAPLRAAVVEFVRGEPAGARRLLDQIDDLLGSVPGDEDLEAVLDAFGSGGGHGADDCSARTWLEQVAQRELLANPVRTRPESVLLPAPAGPPVGLRGSPIRPPAVPPATAAVVVCVRSGDGPGTVPGRRHDDATRP